MSAEDDAPPDGRMWVILAGGLAKVGFPPPTAEHVDHARRYATSLGSAGRHGPLRKQRTQQAIHLLALYSALGFEVRNPDDRQNTPHSNACQVAAKHIQLMQLIANDADVIDAPKVYEIYRNHKDDVHRMRAFLASIPPEILKAQLVDMIWPLIPDNLKAPAEAHAPKAAPRRRTSKRK